MATLDRVPLRDVWTHEAYDSKWLQDNLEATGLSLSGAERDVGNYSAELVTEDDANQLVVIENQLEGTDHDHLGKMMVYFANLEGKAGIWISADTHSEHVQAVTWLNESGLADFYLLKLEAVRIGDSPPAPLLTKIVGPSRESGEAGNVKKNFTERHKLRKDYWSTLLPYANDRTDLHTNISPSRYSYIGTGAGYAGMSFKYIIHQHAVWAELYIDRGKKTHDENLKIFDSLHSEKETIEETYGGSLEWRRLDDERACRIRTDEIPIGYRDQERWDESLEPLVDRMIRLEEALRPHIDALDL